MRDQRTYRIIGGALEDNSADLRRLKDERSENL